MAHIENISALFISSFETAKLIHNAFYFSDKSLPKIYTFYHNSFNDDNRFIQYSLDYGYISQQLLAKIKQENNIDNPHHFGFLAFENHNVLPTQLNLLAISNPSIEALKKLIPHFRKLTGVEVNIETCAFSDIPTELEKNKMTNKYDMVRIDMESLLYFAQSYLLPLEFLSLETLSNYFSIKILQSFCQFQQKIYAIPFDPSFQMLFYRKDLFEDPKIKRLFYEKYKQELVLPTNFEQFNKLLPFFQSGLYEYPQIEKGSALIIDDEGTLASEFFVRYYAICPSIFAKGKIALNSQAVVESLSQLKTLYHHSILLEKCWWKEEVKLFEQRKIPLLIVYMNHFSPLSSEHSNSPIGFTTVPNARPLLGGGSLAILKQTEKQTACEYFIHWFLQNTIQEQYIQLGGMSARKDLMSNPSITQNFPWLALAKQSDFQGVRENILNDQAVNLRQIEAIIGHAVKDYLLKDLSIDNTLAQIEREIGVLNG
ncbi:extracellular solute-binding protein [Glaesserella parasuis]|nr:extracellular solute-binding protein [Glaesserella parasuis]